MMNRKGMWQSLYAPPCHIFLWKIGVNVAPPPFSPFWTNFVCFTGVNTSFWGMVMWLVFWKGDTESLSSALTTIAAVGIVAGLIMSALGVWRGKANHLPAWSKV